MTFINVFKLSYQECDYVRSAVGKSLKVTAEMNEDWLRMRCDVYWNEFKDCKMYG